MHGIIMGLVISLLVAVLAAVLIYCNSLKRNIRKLTKDCNQIKDMDTNTFLVSESADKDITELISVINELLKVKKEAEINNARNSKELKQAITNVSHDLRTPLTSAIGYLQMAEDEMLPPNKRQEFLVVIELKLKSLSHLLDELFTFTKVIEGKTEIQMKRINIANLLRDSVAEFYNDFIEKNMVPDIRIPDVPIYILGDEAACRRVIQNLIQNVLKHGNEYFELTLRTDGSIVMKNNVENMGNVDISRVFERFYTVENSRTGRSTGLGLAIARELMGLMGGELEAFLSDGQIVFEVRFR